MKTRSSTPSHDLAAAKTANPTPQPCSTTPSLDLAAGRKQARSPPANPYHTPTRSTSKNACHTSKNARPTPPPQGDLTSPMLLSEKGVNDDDHRPPPHRSPTNVQRLNAQLRAKKGLSTEWCFYPRRDVTLHRSQKPSQATPSIRS